MRRRRSSPSQGAWTWRCSPPTRRRSKRCSPTSRSSARPHDTSRTRSFGRIPRCRGARWRTCATSSSTRSATPASVPSRPLDPCHRRPPRGRVVSGDGGSGGGRGGRGGSAERPPGKVDGAGGARRFRRAAPRQGGRGPGGRGGSAERPPGKADGGTGGRGGSAERPPGRGGRGRRAPAGTSPAAPPAMTRRGDLGLPLSRSGAVRRDVDPSGLPGLVPCATGGLAAAGFSRTGGASGSSSTTPTTGGGRARDPGR